MNRSHPLLRAVPIVLAMVSLSLSGCTAVGQRALADVASTPPLDRLKAGNVRFATREFSLPKPTTERRKATLRNQKPFALIVDCSDSRVGPETIFDQTIGDLFVVRVAGNLIDSYGLGSLEYGVKNLGARLIVVLGHQDCGAVTAAIKSPDAPPHLGSIVRDLQPAVEAARRRRGPDLLKDATEINARLVAEKIRKEAQFGPVGPEVVIVTGYYVLDSGYIEWAKNERRLE